MDVEPLIKVQENHVRRKPPLGARHHLQPIRVESLSQRLAKLSLPRVEGDNSPPENIVDIIPPEVLMVIFSYLDDISLFAVGNVCRRWYQLLTSQTTPEQWYVAKNSQYIRSNIIPILNYLLFSLYYSGKLFSNQSNRRRHAVLSCDMARDAGVEPRKSRDEKKSPGKTFNEDFYYEDGAPGSMSKTTEQKCPFPGMKKNFLFTDRIHSSKIKGLCLMK